MYSVIIQNKSTTEAFLKYQPLFVEAINNDRIGVCKWNESGTTIDTAVPELRALTDDKEEWKAYIIRFADDKFMSQFEADEQNPYDFITEGDNPLIRLTHMLGEIPAPEPKLSCEEVEENGIPRVVYQSTVDPEEEAAYKELCEKYKFDGVAPSSIVILTVREDFDLDNCVVRKAWDRKREVNSSEFWKRNRYPSNTRFLVYDFVKNGPVQRNADEFGFWLSAMLLTTNKFDTAVIPAYRLYNIRTQIKKEQMQACFQQTVDRLKAVRAKIEEDVRESIELEITAETKLPDYKLDIPVSVNLPEVERRSVNRSAFGLLSKSIVIELNTWEEQKETIEKNLDTSIRIVERTLDITADRMRGNCGFLEEEISCLDQYQVEDMTDETYQMYQEIVEIQGRLPMTKASENPEIVEAEEKVFDNLKERVEWAHAIGILVTSFLLILLAQIPAIVNLVQNEVGSIWFILGSALVEWLIVIVAAFIVAKIQTNKTQKLVDKYNELMKGCFWRLVEEADIFSRYLSNIASHVRGHSYMNLSKRKRYKAENRQISLYKHIKSINVLVSKIKDWNTAFHLGVDFDANVVGKVGYEDEPYTFEFGKSYPVEVNQTGTTINSPFSFVEKIEIVREELYDDDGGSR